MTDPFDELQLFSTAAARQARPLSTAEVRRRAQRRRRTQVVGTTAALTMVVLGAGVAVANSGVMEQWTTGPAGPDTTSTGTGPTTATAQAQSTTILDEAGDTVGPGLDITSVRFRNGENAFEITAAFKRDRPGAVLVWVKPRNLPGVGVTSKHYRQGPDSLICCRQISDDGEQQCGGLSSSWNRTAATVRLRIPARCINGGNYDAVHSYVLIEGLDNSIRDVDYAPEKPNGDVRFTDWIRRG